MAPHTFFSLNLYVMLLLFRIVKSGEYIQLENGNKYYVQRSSNLNWYDAKTLCAEHDMTLITLDTKEGQTDVAQIYKNLNVDYMSWTSAQTKDHLNFVWTTTGKNLNYTNWCADEPLRDSDLKSQCLGFIGVENYCWHSFDCSRFLKVICEESHLKKAKNIECIELKAKYHDLEIELNKSKHEVENLQMQIQEISKNQILAIEFLDNKKNLEIDNIKNFWNKQIGSLTNEIMSLKQSTAMSSNETGNSKTYYLQLNINRN